MVPKYQWCGGFFAKELFQLRFLVFTFPFHFKHKEDTFESDKVTRTHTHTHSLTHTLTKPLTYTYIYNMKKCEEREKEKERERERERSGEYIDVLYKHNRTLEYWTTGGGFKLRGFLRLQASSYGKCAVKI
jgi:hypothetical protein